MFLIKNFGIDIAYLYYITHKAMKKLLLIIAIAFLTCALFAQNKKIEYDDLYYLPSKDAKSVKHVKQKSVIAEDTLLFDAYNAVDTLVKKNPNIQINNYYDNDPFFYSNRIGRFYHGGFNYWMYGNPWYYSNYWMYDPYDWYWESKFMGYPYWNYPYYNGFYFGYNSYWGWNFGWNWNWYHPYYEHNNYWYGGHNNFYGFHQQSKPNIQYGRRERPSNLTLNQPSTRRIVSPQLQERRDVKPQDRPTYSQNRRTYTPSYEQPRMNVRPQYNNTQTQRRTFENQGVQNRISQPNNNIRSSVSTQSRTQTRTYSQPSVNRSSNYNTPSRSYSPPATNRSSNFNSSGADRRSSSSNFSSGGSSGESRSAGSSNSSSNSSGSGHSSSGRR
jgi:hypothetical protein